MTGDPHDDPNDDSHDDARAWRDAVADIKPLPRNDRFAAAPPHARLRRPDLRAGEGPAPRPVRGSEVDARTEGALRRGEMAIDARLDLHGLTQDAAHHALIGFVRASYAAGRRSLLIITGRGAKPGEAWPETPRGVLHARLPDWLAAADLAPYVLRLTPAHRRHGGGGAWYLLLRRRRD